MAKINKQYVCVVMCFVVMIFTPKNILIKLDPVRKTAEFVSPVKFEI